MNVLVVEDNEIVADSLAFLLDCYAHRAVVAHDGETALTLLRTGVFEVVLLDEDLPGIKGSGVARSLVDTPVRPGPFVVSMTGDVDGLEDVARLFDICLEKPFSSEALIQVIEHARSCKEAGSLLAA
jgi:two-component system CheB/CheR fusion protein